MRRARPPAVDDTVVWHDLECGTYRGDLALWLELAASASGPVLDIGAGTGRVAVPLARAGHDVCALDCDHRLLAALRDRAAGLPVTCVHADACAFAPADGFGLCIVPMQTIHLLADRAGFLRCARAALRPGGLLAVALIGDGIEPFEMELEPDRAQRHGVLYESHPTALRLEGDTIVLERRRARIDPTGVRAHRDVIRLAPLAADELAAEAARAGFIACGSRIVAPTDDRAGSVVLVMRRSARGTRPRTATPMASPGKIT
ncbi:MAG: class I SAM-dependent methyltransferase [Solirubrobacteraceae bacterium]